MVFIFDSHPVQYKAPIYQQLQRQKPDSFKVFYATDASVRGSHDRDFNKFVAWDTPLLDGYPNTILHNERGAPFHGFRSLTSQDVYRILERERPSAVLISSFLYEFDLAAYLSCRRLGIPIWIRHETQDEAFPRSAAKTFLRRILYRLAYAGVNHAFYIGQLNREHLLRHGLDASQLSFAPYCSPVHVTTSIPARQQSRDEIRHRLAIPPNEIALLFSGKFIDKKNPSLIFDALESLSPEERNRFQVIFVGSGVMEASLRARAASFPGRVHFTGFINQSEISGYYLAADILILPSRRAGETWGLVVNEALQAGCSVVMTDAVGCHREFEKLERVRVIGDGNAVACAKALKELSRFPRFFDWSAEIMKSYSLEAATAAIAQQIESIERT